MQRLQTQLCATALAALASSTALAADPATLNVFGYTYRVNRFDLTTSVTFPEPISGQGSIGLIECEGTHWIGNGKLLFSSNEMSLWGTYKNMVVEATVTENPLGQVTGLTFSRVVVVNDTNITPFPNDFDLDPAGITLNLSSTGLGAGGQVVVADSNAERLVAYDFQTGQLLPGIFSLLPFNDNTEDVLFHDGKFYTVHEDQTPVLSIEVFDTLGNHVQTIPIAADANPNALGSPKGIALIPSGSRLPPELAGHGDLLMIALDDNGPALQFFDLQGNEVGYFPLTIDGTPSGAPILDSGSQTLQIESVTFDPITGRIFLTQQGSGVTDNYVWVLSPLVENYGNGCAGSGNFIPSLAATGLLASGEFLQFDINEGLGGSTALLFLGTGKTALPVTPGCFFYVSPILTSLSLPLTFGGPGQGSTGFGSILPPGIPSGFRLTAQVFVADSGVFRGYSNSQGLYLESP